MASTNRGTTRVLLLADAPVLRRGLVGMINETAGMQSVGTPGELRRALRLVASARPPRGATPGGAPAARRPARAAPPGVGGGRAGRGSGRDPQPLPRPAPPLSAGRH